MPQTRLRCDHALFTSVRTPMGEGYRIIAASKGLKPGEKQEITRNSPSHEALCFDGDCATESPLAVAFYPLETGRRCLSMSRFAGAEHTGRGGQRVHTHIVVFEPDQLAHLGFNPLRILRALLTHDGGTPLLDPPAILPELDLLVGDSDELTAPPFSTETRMHILRAMLGGQDLVVAMPGDWLATAEGLLLGLPGPRRADFSFGAGLQFSLTRLHRLNLLSDAKGKAKLRTTGQNVEYLNADAGGKLKPGEPSTWVSFVERCYADGDMERLRRRTSRNYADTTPAGCEQLGQIFETIDGIPNCDLPTLVAMGIESFPDTYDGVAGELQRELIDAIKRVLPDRIAAAPAEELTRLWDEIVVLWRHPGREIAFTQDILTLAVSRICEESPVEGAKRLAELGRGLLPQCHAVACQTLFDQVIGRLLRWVSESAEMRASSAAPVARLWQGIRPNCETVSRLVALCETESVASHRA